MMFTRKVDPNDPMPRYYQIYTFLVDRIQSGEFTPGCAIPTERDLGEQYGVSRITVIKSLDMLERDGYVVRQQGRGTFVANTAERGGLSNGQIASPTLAYITFSLSHPYISDIMVGIASSAAQLGHPLHIYGSVNSSEGEVTAVNDAIRRGVQGLIVNPWREYRNAQLYADLQARGFPVVMVDRYYTEVATDNVIYENELAGYDVTSALIGQGHSRIAFIPSQEQRTTSVRQRLNGYRRALEEHGLTYDEDLIWSDMPSTFVASDGHLTRTSATDELLRNHLNADKPTGLLAVNIDVAELLVDAFCSDSPCIESRTSIASNLAIGTFDHKELPVGTPLVSVLALHPGKAVGVAATNILAGRLHGTLPAEQQCVRLPMQILQLLPNQATMTISPIHQER
jgi:GntR family transcriptional regulator of arabinose operon